MIETDRQRQIIKQIKLSGGHAYKASNAYTAGIPDIASVLRTFGPCVIEVKDLGEISNAKFNRKVDTTALQKETMSQMNAVNGALVAFVMVTFKRGSKVYVASIPALAECITNEEAACSELSNLHKEISNHVIKMREAFSRNPNLFTRTLSGPVR